MKNDMLITGLDENCDTAADIPSPCGAVCGGCERFPNECAGCRAVKGRVWWVQYTGQNVCPFYACCVDDKHLPHCGKCDRFPCALFQRGDPTKSNEENAAILKKQIETLTKDR